VLLRAGPVSACYVSYDRVDGGSNSGKSVFFPSAAIAQLRSSIHPTSITSRPRLTLADRAPPLR